MKKTKTEYIHTYDIKYEVDMQVTDIKLFLGQLESGQYKITFKIFSGDKVVYYQTFDENTFAHFAFITYAKQTNN